MEAVSPAWPFPLFASAPLVTAQGCSPCAAQPSMVRKMAHSVPRVAPSLAVTGSADTMGQGQVSQRWVLSHTPEATGKGLLSMASRKPSLAGMMPPG